MYSRIDHIQGHKTSLNKFKKIEIFSSNYPDHNGMKLSIQQDITILIVYTVNNKASKYIKQKLIKLKGKIGKFPIIVGDFNTTLSVIETSRQKIAKNIRRPEKYYQLI